MRGGTGASSHHRAEDEERQRAIGSPSAHACQTDLRWMAYPPKRSLNDRSTGSTGSTVHSRRARPKGLLRWARVRRFARDEARSSARDQVTATRVETWSPRERGASRRCCTGSESRRVTAGRAVATAVSVAACLGGRALLSRSKRAARTALTPRALPSSRASVRASQRARRSSRGGGAASNVRGNSVSDVTFAAQPHGAPRARPRSHSLRSGRVDLQRRRARVSRRCSAGCDPRRLERLRHVSRSRPRRQRRSTRAEPHARGTRRLERSRHRPRALPRGESRGRRFVCVDASVCSTVRTRAVRHRRVPPRPRAGCTTGRRQLRLSERGRCPGRRAARLTGGTVRRASAVREVCAATLAA